MTWKMYVILIPAQLIVGNLHSTAVHLHFEVLDTVLILDEKNNKISYIFECVRYNFRDF